MKQRRIEAAAVEIDGIGPLAVDGGTGDQVVVEVAQRRTGGAAHGGAAVTFNVRVDQPEQAIAVTEAWRPHSAGIGIAEHVELAGTIQWAREQPPVHQVARVVDLHAGKPLERRGRDVVVVADANDGRIGIESRQNRISDHCARPVEGGVTSADTGVLGRSRTTTQSQMAARISNTPSATKNGE